MAINFLDGITVDGNINFGTGNKFQTVTNALEGVGANGVFLRSAISSAANPSFSNSDDTNTGMFLPGSDILGLSTAGSERLRITSAGSVGIGTTAPAAKLDILDAVNQTAIRVTNNNYNNYLIQKRRTDNSQILGIQEFGSNGGLSLVTGGSQRVNVNNLGNVGIGTTTPAVKLHVSGGDIRVDDTERLEFGSGGVRINNDAAGRMYNRAPLGFYWETNGGYRMVLDSSGRLGVGTTSPSARLQVNAASGTTQAIIGYGTQNLYVGVNGTNVDLKSSGNSVGTFSFSTGNTERIRITSAGNVGIGNTSPSTKLDVNGTFQATSVRSTGGGDGGFVLRQWTYQSNYASLATNGMSSLEYCMISDGTNTFVGAGSGGSLYLRGPANDSSPQIQLDGSLCKVDSGDFKVEDGSIAVGNISNSATNGRIDASNDVVAFSTSDIRLKDNIKSIDKALDKVNSIQGIEFDWIEKEEVHGNSGHDIGVIAQEIEKVLPDIVTTRDNGYKAVKYEKIVPLLIEAIKDLSKQVDGLKRLI